MYHIENFELSQPRAAAFYLKAGCVIRVTAGCLWLTLQGQSDDVWLQAGGRWTLPAKGMVWLSAEPAAAFQLARPGMKKWRPGWRQVLNF